MVGTCNIKYGYMITIFKIESIEDGVVNESGAAVFNVAFKVLVFRQLRGEVLDGVASGIEKVGIEIRVGSVKAFIPHTKIPEELRFSQERGEFCSEVELGQVLRKGSFVRFKVENVTVKGGEGAMGLNVIGCISDHYLGMV